MGSQECEYFGVAIKFRHTLQLPSNGKTHLPPMNMILALTAAQA
jgi:hypothetical protein